MPTSSAGAAAASRGLTRLNKVLSQKLGLCSRREADRYIEGGLVRVDGAVVTELGTKVDYESSKVELLLDPEEVQHQKRTIIFNKPLGVVSCQPDRPEQVPAIRLCTKDREWVPPAGGKNRGRRDREQHGSPSRWLPEPRRQGSWAAAGRLDVNSTGLLVLTQSGLVASQIIGGGGGGGGGGGSDDSSSRINKVEKEYLVRLDGGVDLLEGRGTVLDKLEELRAGVVFGGDELRAKSVEVLNGDQLRVVLLEGKRHHIRRMLAAVDWNVQALKRVRIGNVALGRLPLGYWRYVDVPGEESFV